MNALDEIRRLEAAYRKRQQDAAREAEHQAWNNTAALRATVLHALHAQLRDLLPFAKMDDLKAEAQGLPDRVSVSVTIPEHAPIEVHLGRSYSSSDYTVGALGDREPYSRRDLTVWWSGEYWTDYADSYDLGEILATAAERYSDYQAYLERERAKEEAGPAAPSLAQFFLSDAEQELIIALRNWLAERQPSDV